MTPYIAKSIPLSEIKVDKYTVHAHGIDVKINDLTASIKEIGLLSPIIVYYDSEKKYYIMVAGQRRLNAYHLLNNDNPNTGFDKINCFVIDKSVITDQLEITEELEINDEKK